MRGYFNTDETPTRPRPRKRPPAAIPPFSLFGPLDVSDSGMWYPPRAVLLTGATMTASALPPDSTGPFAILHIVRLDNPRQETILASRGMSPDSYQATFKFAPESYPNPPVITPFEPVFVRSLRASGHENVVVQLVGEYI